MRAFVALPVPDPVSDLLIGVQDGLTDGRLVPSENLHVTLAFLDNQPQSVLAELHNGLSAAGRGPVPVASTEMVLFGGRTPGLAALGVAADPALVALRDRVRRAAQEVGIDLPRARFRPHITLVRYRRGLSPEQVVRIARDVETVLVRPFSYDADHMCLYKSTLTDDGPLYDVLAEYPL